MNRGSQVDKYRKRIGKQDAKKTRTLSQSIKNSSDARQSAIGIKEICLYCLALFVLLASVYLVFYVTFGMEWAAFWQLLLVVEMARFKYLLCRLSITYILLLDTHLYIIHSARTNYNLSLGISYYIFYVLFQVGFRLST